MGSRFDVKLLQHLLARTRHVHNHSKWWDSCPWRSCFWGTKNAGINYGILFTAYGVAGIIGPRIGGALFDKYKNYQAAFFTAGALALVALVFELLAKRPSVPGAKETAR